MIWTLICLVVAGLISDALGVGAVGSIFIAGIVGLVAGLIEVSILHRRKRDHP